MLKQSKIAGIGSFVPKNTITNDDLSKVMDTSDAWIQERTGIRERRYTKAGEETTTTMGVKAATIAIERAGLTPQDIDFIIFATLSPDYYFPGCGVLLQREMKMREIGALDIRNQCSGFIYGISVADQFIKTGMYKNVLVVGSEMHSMGLDFTTKGRNVAVIFGDGAGAVVLQATEEKGKGILSTHLHSDGNFAEELCVISPGSHSGKWADKEQLAAMNFQTNSFGYGDTFITKSMVDAGHFYPIMNGQTVFKKAITKFPEVINEALQTNNLTTSDIDLLVPHQANLRIAEFVQRSLRLADDKVFNNIQKYGNTTAASIPIALCEAWESGKVKEGNLICLAAFGSGFTWGSALIRW